MPDERSSRVYQRMEVREMRKLSALFVMALMVGAVMPADAANLKPLAPNLSLVIQKVGAGRVTGSIIVRNSGSRTTGSYMLTAPVKPVSSARFGHCTNNGCLTSFFPGLAPGKERRFSLSFTTRQAALLSSDSGQLCLSAKAIMKTNNVRSIEGMSWRDASSCTAARPFLLGLDLVYGKRLPSGNQAVQILIRNYGNSASGQFYIDFSPFEGRVASSKGFSVDQDGRSNTLTGIAPGGQLKLSAEMRVTPCYDLSVVAESVGSTGLRTCVH
jgi:hypothetical protein